MLPIQIDAGQNIKDRSRRGAAGHTKACLSIAADKIGKFARKDIGKIQHHHFAVWIGLEFHSLISRQRRLSLCSNINASSGPADPGW